MMPMSESEWYRQCTIDASWAVGQAIAQLKAENVAGDNQEIVIPDSAIKERACILIELRNNIREAFFRKSEKISGGDKHLEEDEDGNGVTIEDIEV